MYERLPDKVKNVIGVVLLLAVPVLVIAAITIGLDDREPDEPEAAPEPVREYTIQTPDTIPGDVVEIPDEQDMAQAQAIAEQFVEQFHRLDPENPFLYVEQAKPFMTNDMYTRYKDVPKRATLGIAEENTVEMELWADHLQQHQQIWRVQAHGEKITIEGEKGFTFTEYVVNLIKQDGNWKVDGVAVNAE